MNNFVGHQNELLQILEKHKESVNGFYRICFITGEAGSGKSWLVEEFCKTAFRNNSNVLCARSNCDALSGVGTPYVPFLNLLESLIESFKKQKKEQDLAGHRMDQISKVSKQVFNYFVDKAPDLIGSFISASSLVINTLKELADEFGLMDKLKLKLNPLARICNPGL